MTMELYFLASSLSLVGRHDEALAAADEAVEKARTEEGPHSLYWSLVYAGRIEAEAGRHQASIERFAEVERLVAAHPELPASMLATGTCLRALALVERGGSATAVTAAEQALHDLERLGRRPREILTALLVLARAQNDTGAYAAAAATAARALPLARQRLGGLAHSRHVGAAELETARASWAAGDTAAARAAVRRALENLRASLGDDAPETGRARALAERLG
jgi:tetratricopeptide (TPR) repeat protein